MMPADVSHVKTLLEQYGPPLLQSFAAIIIAWLLFQFICRAVNKLSNRGMIPAELRYILHKLIKWLIMIVLLLVILGLFGVSVASFWAALSGVLVLLAIGFVAVWSLLSNLLCSVLLIVFSPFRVGDEIEVQDPASPVTVRGTVSDINLMFTTLVMIDDKQEKSLLRVPNNIFFQKYVRTWESHDSESIRNYMAHSRDDKQSD